MRLAELHPEWVKRTHEGYLWLKDDSTDADVDGIWFICPRCFARNGFKREGVHGILCWRPKVPAHIAPGPGRWEFVGYTFDTLTMVASSSSILLTGGCAAHFFVTEGNIVNADPSW